MEFEQSQSPNQIQMQFLSKLRPISLLTLTLKLKLALQPFNCQTLVFLSSSTTFPSTSKPNPTIITTLIQLLLKKHPNLHHKTKQIHAQIITHALSSNSSLLAALIRAYILSNDLSYAQILLYSYSFSSPSLVLWNQIIQAYCKTPNSQHSIHLFRRLLSLDQTSLCFPDLYTFTFVITACSHQHLPACGRSVHGLVLKVGCELDTFVGNALVNFYSIFFKADEAQRVFEDMPHRDVITWTSLLSGYTKCGDIGRAIKLFCIIPERNTISWAVMVAGYVGSGRYYAALGCFNDMLCDDKLKPNEAILVSALSACTHLGALEQGKWIHVYINKSKVFVTLNITNALIDMYAKCGRIDVAKKLFDGITRKDVVTWTSMIVGLSMHGLGKDALRTFNQMLAEEIRPSSITLLGVLSGCSHSGMVEEGCLIFHNMENEWGITPQIEHYGCLVDLLGRAGQLKSAFKVVKNMPMDPDVVIWRALLSACRTHGDVDFGERIIYHVSGHLDPSFHGEGCMLVSNLYASLGQWDKVSRVRTEMNEKKIKSTSLGGSWIEVDGIVHEFLAVDQLHPRITEIRDMLNEVLRRISAEGHYVAGTKHVLFDLVDEEKEHALFQHSEKLAIAFGLLSTKRGSTLQIVKNLRICDDCHSVMKAISQVFNREIVVRDRSRYHDFKEGRCSCRDYW